MTDKKEPKKTVDDLKDNQVSDEDFFEGGADEDTGSFDEPDEARERMQEQDDGIDVVKQKISSMQNVMTYKHASDSGMQDLVDLMDDNMADIDEHPDDYDVLSEFGVEPIRELGEIAHKALSVQADFDKSLNVFGSSLGNWREGIKEIGIEKKAKAVKRFSERAKDSAVGGLEKSVRLMKNMVNFAERARRSEDEKEMEELARKLPEMKKDMERLMETVKSSAEGLSLVEQQARELGRKNMEAARKLNSYIGCYEELIERYSDPDPERGYIAEAKQKWQETRDPMDEQYYNDVVERRGDLVDHFSMLEAARATQIMTATALKKVVDTVRQQKKQITVIENIHQNQWMMQLAVGGLAGATHKSQTNIDKVHKTTEEMHEVTMDMLEKSHQSDLANRGRGVLPAEQIVDALQKLDRMAQDTHEKLLNSQESLEATRQGLRDAANGVLDATDRRSSEALDAKAGSGSMAPKKQKKAENDNKSAAGSARRARKQNRGPSA